MWSALTVGSPVDYLLLLLFFYFIAQSKNKTEPTGNDSDETRRPRENPKRRIPVWSKTSYGY